MSTSFVAIPAMKAKPIAVMPDSYYELVIPNKNIPRALIGLLPHLLLKTRSAEEADAIFRELDARFK